MSANPLVHVVVPDGIDDPTMPSGGNVYDQRLCRELGRSGWSVSLHAVTGGLDEALQEIPDGSVALVDGLVAVDASHVILRESERLRIVVLLHMPFGERDDDVRPLERHLLTAAAAVVTTSEWSRQWVLRSYGLRPSTVHVAEPGADAADLVTVREAGVALLCVAAVTADKGHDALLSALAEVADLPWRLTCVGSLSLDRDLAEGLQRQASQLGLGDRVAWTGALSGDELDKAYAAADVLVLATRAESWGMVVTESLSRAIPVLASEVGGVSEALGETSGGRPGVLVPADDPRALAEAIRGWLSDDLLRVQLRAAARARRTTLEGWSVTASRVAHVLAEVAR